MSKTAADLLALLAIAACLMGTQCLAPEAPPALPDFTPPATAPGGGTGGGSKPGGGGVDGNDGSSNDVDAAPPGYGPGLVANPEILKNNLGVYVNGPNQYQGGHF